MINKLANYNPFLCFWYEKGHKTELKTYMKKKSEKKIAIFFKLNRKRISINKV